MDTATKPYRYAINAGPWAPLGFFRSTLDARGAALAAAGISESAMYEGTTYNDGSGIYAALGGNKVRFEVDRGI